MPIEMRGLFCEPDHSLMGDNLVNTFYVGFLEASTILRLVRP